MVVNIGRPRQEVYAPDCLHWYLRYFTALFLIAVIAVGVVRRRRAGRNLSVWVTADGGNP